MKLKNLTIPVLIWLVVTTLGKYSELTKPGSDTEVDQINKTLLPVKNLVSPSFTIGFLSNMPKGQHGVLYFKSALALAPAVLGNSVSDTVLIYEDPSHPPLQKDHFKCIASGRNDQFNYFLMTSRK